MVHIYWDKVLKEYRVVVPTQWVGKATVDAVLSQKDALDEERYLHYADIHSHNTMPAKFSRDVTRRIWLSGAPSILMTASELATSLSTVVIRPVEARISCNGRFVTIPVSQIIAPLPMDFPGHWADTVHTGRREVA